jgi:hypothetical protein
MAGRKLRKSVAESLRWERRLPGGPRRSARFRDREAPGRALVQSDKEKVVYDFAMTVDGFICRPDGSIDDFPPES